MCNPHCLKTGTFRSALAIALLACAPAWAQQTSETVIGPAQQRPHIGLVLEGGGALGFAHIGVIKWLEEHHIPIDYVAGTSMGGLVGGLYASGQSPAEIAELTKNIKWDSVLNGLTPFQDLNFRRKEDRIAYPNRLEFGLKGGFHAPTGLELRLPSQYHLRSRSAAVLRSQEFQRPSHSVSLRFDRYDHGEKEGL